MSLMIDTLFIRIHVPIYLFYYLWQIMIFIYQFLHVICLCIFFLIGVVSTNLDEGEMYNIM